MGTSSTPTVGTRAAEEVLRRPGLALVGLYTRNPEKQGRDVGELLGGPAAGVRATGDPAAARADDVDVVLHAPLPSQVYGEREGADLEDICALLAAGKDVIELEIGDSPFPSAAAAVEAGIAAVQADHCHYGPSTGLPEFRQAAADYVNREYNLEATAEHVVAGPGAKTFEQLFCETFLNPGDGVLVFAPYFPTYAPNIDRRAARMVLAPLREEDAFRPRLASPVKEMAAGLFVPPSTTH